LRGGVSRDNGSLLFHITGGDDVQQLCEGGEEEFLDIMILYYSILQEEIMFSSCVKQERRSF